jgi:phosphatidate cytidylyltransferase
VTAPDPSGSEPPRSRVSWADLGPRLISAAILIAGIATVLHFGGYVFAVATGVVFALTYREWERMVTLKPLTPFGMGLMALLVVSALVFPVFGWGGTVAVICIAGVAAIIMGPRDLGLWRVGGLVFLAFVIVAVLAMRGTETAGITAGWFLGLVIGSNDTGAYFVGRVIGGEKLAPGISPAKTWSGAIGGWVIGTAVGTIFWLVFAHSPLWIGFVLAASTGLLGQVGDLSESAIKRRFRVKDSGDIIPGHGGLMDRLDSTTFGVLFVFAVGALHSGVGNIATGFLNW